MSTTYSTIDANEAVASVAYRYSEVAAIYPITPSSPMGESSESWSAIDRPNLWGTVPSIVELQSEAGAAGTVHGALQTGSLATTFTASQGLLLMIPNMYKIAGELTPCVFHVAARAVAAQALSIFGDHSDVMSTRSCGWAMLCGASTQEAADMACIAHAATLESRVPFVNFFDGFRTSHEVGKIADIPDDVLRAMIKEEWIEAFRSRALTPDAPVVRGTAQNPDVYFQGREAGNKYYLAVPGIVQAAMDRFAGLTGRQYSLVEYTGPETATRVVVMMGSGSETAIETIEALNADGSNDVGVVRIHLYRPFPAEEFVKALPKGVRRIAVLDRTKEPGSLGEPLLQDVIQTLFEAQAKGSLPGAAPLVVGGRYGIGSKEFTPAMAKAVFDNLSLDRPKAGFTVGIEDDVLGASLPVDPSFSTEADDVTRAMFYGLGSDGTIGANKDSIKIIGKHTPLHIQGYFEYDSKKSGSTTVSHLRFGPRPIRSTYLITSANFIALHQPTLLDTFDFLKNAKHGATFLINSPAPADRLWDTLPARMQRQIQEKEISVYTIDAFTVARKTGMGGRINTIMQTCFFALADVIPAGEAIEYIKQAIAKTYAKKGQEVIDKNIAAVNATLENLHKVETQGKPVNGHEIKPPLPDEAPDFVKRVLGKIITGNGNSVTVGELPDDGTFPSGTTKWEKRDLALDLPIWDPDTCIQCGKCTAVCPHAAIRSKVFDPEELAGAPDSFKCADAKSRDWKGRKFVIQVSAGDCTGCTLCTDVCPAKNKLEPGRKAINMSPAAVHRGAEAANWKFFEKLPEVDRTKVKTNSIMSMQFLQPLFEFSGACAGCGETPYVKMLTQLFGNRLVVANATGCSSIYGGNLPTTPWAHGRDGRGPAWCNSLFEDNAEFGLGFRVSLDKKRDYAVELLKEAAPIAGDALVGAILGNPQQSEADIAEQRALVEQLKNAVQGRPECARLRSMADYLVRKSVWILGGDGWAYDIGYGGLDHVMASGRNVNILVLDTEVYSNTGGQMSKSTPRGAVAKFAAGGKRQGKKDLALMAMAYGSVYVGRVAMGANDAHTVKTFLEAEAFDGPSIIIAYSHCIAHGIEMYKGLEQQKKAVDSGHWILMRYNPTLAKEGKNPLTIDSKEPTLPLADYIYNEVRYKTLQNSNPEEAKILLEEEEKELKMKWRYYKHLAAMDYSQE